MKLPQKLAKEATISFMSMGFGSGVRYLFVLILARWVGPAYLGVFSLANALMRFAEVIGKAGLDNGVLAGGGVEDLKHFVGCAGNYFGYDVPYFC